MAKMEMNPKQNVSVTIEYCGVCNFKRQCEDLSKIINEIVPEARVKCKTGRRGAFEVKINDTLVHSKLSTMAFPEYKEVAQNVQKAKEGKPVTKVSEQPITDCRIQ